MANLSSQSCIHIFIGILVCICIESFGHHHRHRYTYHNYFGYPNPYPPTGFVNPANNVQFSAQPGNCVTLQSYSPPEKACTYCICFPDNWYNCWSQIGCLGHVQPQPQPPSPVFPVYPPLTIQSSSPAPPLTYPTTLRPVGEDARPTLGSIKPVGEVQGTTEEPEVEFILSSSTNSFIPSNENNPSTEQPVTPTVVVNNEINEIVIK